MLEDINPTLHLQAFATNAQNCWKTTEMERLYRDLHKSAVLHFTIHFTKWSIRWMSVTQQDRSEAPECEITKNRETWLRQWPSTHILMYVHDAYDRYHANHCKIWYHGKGHSLLAVSLAEYVSWEIKPTGHVFEPWHAHVCLFGDRSFACRHTEQFSK